MQARADAERQLAEYDEVNRELSAEDQHVQDHPFWLLTVSAGKHSAATTIAWTTEALGVLDDLAARPSVPSRDLK